MKRLQYLTYHFGIIISLVMVVWVALALLPERFTGKPPINSSSLESDEDNLANIPKWAPSNYPPTQDTNISLMAFYDKQMKVVTKDGRFKVRYLNSLIGDFDSHDEAERFRRDWIWRTLHVNKDEIKKEADTWKETP